MFEELLRLFTELFTPPRLFPPLTFLEYLYSWIMFSIIIIFILIVYSISIFIFKKIAKKKKISLDILNGVKIIFRLFTIIFITLLFISVSASLIPGGIPPEVAVIISAITGSIVAFSSTTILQNFIAGLYILFTRPYRIGDLIKIGDQEGIVEEVSLNHTKLIRASKAKHMVSNLTVINSEIINFSITHEMLKPEELLTLKDIFYKKDLVRYWFTLELPKERPERTKKILEEILEKYKDIFHFPPEFYVNAILHKIVFDIVIITDKPNLIQKYKTELIKDIYLRIFEK